MNAKDSRELRGMGLGWLILCLVVLGGWALGRFMDTFGDFVAFLAAIGASIGLIMLVAGHIAEDV
jgi:hypothetical protein